MNGKEWMLLTNLSRMISVLIMFVGTLSFISLFLLCSSGDDVCLELIPAGTVFRLEINESPKYGRCLLPVRTQAEICGASNSCVPRRSIRRTAMVTLAERHRLAVCHIPKNMLTVSMALTCYLSDPSRFESSNKTLTTDMWSKRACFRKNELRFPDEQRILDERWMHLAIVRDPVEKFLSGWLEKCYYRTPDDRHWKPNQCYRCGQNLTCFVQRNYEKLLKRGNRVPAWSEEDHFWPQNWFCGFHRYGSRYKLLKFAHDKNASFFRSLFVILRDRQVPSALLSNIESQVLSSLTKHATFNRPQTLAISQQLLCDKELLRLIVKTYFHDYAIFGYDLPCL